MQHFYDFFPLSLFKRIHYLLNLTVRGVSFVTTDRLTTFFSFLSLKSFSLLKQIINLISLKLINSNSWSCEMSLASYSNYSFKLQCFISFQFGESHPRVTWRALASLTLLAFRTVRGGFSIEHRMLLMTVTNSSPTFIIFH